MQWTPHVLVVKVKKKIEKDKVIRIRFKLKNPYYITFGGI